MGCSLGRDLLGQPGVADTAPCSVQPGFTVGIIGLCHSARRPLQLGFLWDTPSQLPAFRLALTTARIRIGKGAGGACRQPLSRCLQSFQRGMAVLEEPGPLVQTPKHPLLRPGAPWLSLEQDHGRPQAQRCGTRCWCVSASLWGWLVWNKCSFRPCPAPHPHGCRLHMAVFPRATWIPRVSNT